MKVASVVASVVALAGYANSATITCTRAAFPAGCQIGAYPGDSVSVSCGTGDTIVPASDVADKLICKEPYIFNPVKEITEPLCVATALLTVNEWIGITPDQSDLTEASGALVFQVPATVTEPNTGSITCTDGTDNWYVNITVVPTGHKATGWKPAFVSATVLALASLVGLMAL